MTGVTNFGDIVASPMYECDLPYSRSKSKMRHSDWCGELIAAKNGRIRLSDHGTGGDGDSPAAASAEPPRLLALGHARSSCARGSRAWRTQRTGDDPALHASESGVVSPASLDATIRLLERRGNNEAMAGEPRPV
jgi:hypothetical protein